MRERAYYEGVAWAMAARELGGAGVTTFDADGRMTSCFVAPGRDVWILHHAHKIVRGMLRAAGHSCAVVGWPEANDLYAGWQSWLIVTEDELEARETPSTSSFAEWANASR